MRRKFTPSYAMRMSDQIQQPFEAHTFRFHMSEQLKRHKLYIQLHITGPNPRRMVGLLIDTIRSEPNACVGGTPLFIERPDEYIEYSEDGMQAELTITCDLTTSVATDPDHYLQQRTVLHGMITDIVDVLNSIQRKSVCEQPETAATTPNDFFTLPTFDLGRVFPTSTTKTEEVKANPTLQEQVDTASPTTEPPYDLERLSTAVTLLKRELKLTLHTDTVTVMVEVDPKYYVVRGTIEVRGIGMTPTDPTIAYLQGILARYGITRISAIDRDFRMGGLPGVDIVLMDSNDHRPGVLMTYDARVVRLISIISGIGSTLLEERTAELFRHQVIPESNPRYQAHKDPRYTWANSRPTPDYQMPTNRITEREVLSSQLMKAEQRVAEIKHKLRMLND